MRAFFTAANKKKGKIVLTTGVFDCGMHIGHFMFLLQCHELAGPDGEVIVGVNSDYSASDYKRRPVFDHFERMQAVSQLPFITKAILIKSESDIEETIKINNVDYYVKGAEWANKKITGEDLCHIILFKNTTDWHGNKVSTTELIRRIKEYSIEPTPNQQTVLEAAKKDNLI